MPDLEECPFCGRDPYVIEPDYPSGHFQIGCLCGEEEDADKELGACWRDGKTMEEARGRWNNRSLDPVDVVAAVRRDGDGRVWLCKRNADGAHAGLRGMWEYPGGKVEADEQLRDALVRELREEFGVLMDLTVRRVLDSISARYQDTVYRVTFFEVEITGPVELRCHSEARWMTPDEACSVDHLPSGTIFNARHLAR